MSYPCARFTLVTLLILTTGSEAWAHIGSGTGFGRPRTLLERAAHTNVMAVVSIIGQPEMIDIPTIQGRTRSIPTHHARVEWLIHGQVPSSTITFMQGSLRPIHLEAGSLAPVSLSRTVDFIEPGVPRPPEMPPPVNAPPFFTQQSRDEVTEFRLYSAPALVQYLAKALPIDAIPDPKERASALSKLSFDTLAQDVPAELLFEALRNLLILSTETALSLTREQTKLLTAHAQRNDHAYNIRHLSILVAVKGPAEEIEPELSTIARQKTDIRLRALAAGELARRNNPKHIPLFMELARSGDPYLVRASTLGLAKLDHAPAVTLFETLLNTSDTKMIRAVVRALGIMTNTESRSLLRQLAAASERPAVQKEAKRELIRRRIPE